MVSRVVAVRNETHIISKSIEEQIEDWCKKQFKGQKYYTKTETVNAEIAYALEKAPSKQGWTVYIDI